MQPVFGKDLNLQSKKGDIAMENQMNQMSSRDKRNKFTSMVFGLLLIVVMLSAGLRPAIASTFASAGKQVEAQTGISSGANTVVNWNTIAVRTTIQVARYNPSQAQMYLARIQAAVYNAVVAIERGYQPYKSKLAPQPEASVDAAVATAAYRMLVHHFADQQIALDADYAAALATIPDGPAKAAGVEVGQAAAEEMIALRAGDGLEGDIGFTMPNPAPGVWQLPAGSTPVSPWISQLRPYLLNSPDQFRPSPPPDLSSSEWADQFKEVKLMGRRDSLYRTAEQTDIARFWTASSAAQYNSAFQQITRKRELNAVEAARLFAMGNMVGADALIGCLDAKYYYLFWRPEYAIPLGDSDGNPATIGDPTWKPLLSTPAHPEYPSGHACVTSATAEVLVAFLGTQQIELDVRSNVPNLMQPTRHFKYAHDLVQEIIDARVWGGIHYRESDVKGSTLGRKVAHWALQRYFLPVP